MDYADGEIVLCVFHVVALVVGWLVCMCILLFSLILNKVLPIYVNLRASGVIPYGRCEWQISSSKFFPLTFFCQHLFHLNARILIGDPILASFFYTTTSI